MRACTLETATWHATEVNFSSGVSQRLTSCKEAAARETCNNRHREHLPSLTRTSGQSTFTHTSSRNCHPTRTCPFRLPVPLPHSDSTPTSTSPTMILRFSSSIGQFRLTVEPSTDLASLLPQIVEKLTPDTLPSSVSISPQRGGQSRSLESLKGVTVQKLGLAYVLPLL